MIRGLELSARADVLLPILECWLTNFERACRVFPQTRRAWYIEPTLVSLLSTASWQAGLPSIVEAKADRAGASDPKLDLLIQGPDGCLAFEAKIHYVPSKPDARRISDKLKEALDEASQVSHPLAKRYFGLSFVLLEQQDPNTDLSNVLATTLEHARNNNPSLDALAWTLLDQPTAIYRGCALAAQEAHRAQGMVSQGTAPRMGA